jgi:hypothetical protein
MIGTGVDDHSTIRAETVFLPAGLANAGFMSA